MSSRPKPEKGRKRGAPPAPAPDYEPEPEPQSRAILIARQSLQTISWLFVVFIASYIAVQCDRYVLRRRIEAPHSSVLRDKLDHALEGVDDVLSGLEALNDKLGDIAPSPIRFNEGDEICLREGFGDGDADSSGD